MNFFLYSWDWPENGYKTLAKKCRWFVEQWICVVTEKHPFLVCCKHKDDDSH